MNEELLSLICQHFDRRFSVLNEKVDKLMSGQDDFNTALAALQAEATTVEATVASLLQQLTAAKDNGDDAAFETAAGQITTITSGLAAAVQAVTPPASSATPAPTATAEPQAAA